MKNRFKIITATLAVGAAATLAGCGGCIGCTSCSGCGGDTAVNTITRSNWFTGTSYSGIQPSFIDSGNAEENAKNHFSKEVIEYDVTYDKTNANNNNVSLDYKDGHFTTEFYATGYDWSKSGIPEGYAPEKATKEIVYYYKTELTVSVKFKMKTGDLKESDWYNDHVITEAYFRAAGNNLQPVYSRQQIVSTSPKNYQPVTLEQAIEHINVTYENYYNYNCTKVLSYTTENGEKAQKEYGNLNKLDKTLFDNSSLYIAVRSMKLSSNLSQPVALFSAAAGGIDEYAVVGTDSALTAEEKEVYTNALKGKDLFKADGDKTQVETVAVNVSYAGGDLHGTSQTVWYAAITDNDNNVPRATMLKLSVPISYSLGTLNFSLTEIKETLWNGK